MYDIAARGDLIINSENSGILIDIDGRKYSIFEKARVESKTLFAGLRDGILKAETRIERQEVHFTSDGNRLKVSSRIRSSDLPDGKIAALSLVTAALLSIVNSIKEESFMVNDSNNFTKIKNIEITKVEEKVVA